MEIESKILAKLLPRAFESFPAKIGALLLKLQWLVEVSASTSYTHLKTRGDGCAGPCKPNMRLFQASHAVYLLPFPPI
jgi:hypothetical protein